MNHPPATSTIRPAEPADAAVVAQLMQTEPGFWQPGWSTAMIARTLAAPTTIAFVARAPRTRVSPLPLGEGPGVRENPRPSQPSLSPSPPPHAPPNELAAFACAHNLGFRGYLSELIVAPICRGQGIASALLAAIEQRLRDEGCPLLIADVWRDAEEFYRNQGWTPPDAVLLRKHLPPT